MKRILLSTLAASLLVSGSFAKETAAKGATVKQVNTIAVNNAKEDAKDHKAKLVQEAVDSLKYAHDALVALNKKDTKSAKTNLEKALGKLDVVLASEHAPKLLPVDNVITAVEYVGTSKDAEVAVKLAENLLDDGKVQAAREILLPLKSEIDVTVVNLPLATYPDALKLAAKYMTDGEAKKAKTVLATALSTFVEVTTVAPIPLLKATDLIVAAAAIASEDNKQAKVYLTAAQEQLKLAEVLGYTSKSDVTYKALDEAIDDIKDHIASKEIKAKFDALKAKLKAFSSKIFSSKEGARQAAQKAAEKK